MTRKSIIINYKHIRKAKTLQDKYRNKRKLKKLIDRWKIALVFTCCALITILAAILVNLPEKRVQGEQIDTIESNIIYAIAPLETKINPKEEIIQENHTITAPLKKTIVREVKKPQGDIQKQVQSIASEYGWGNGEQWEALSWIIQKESSWNPNAQNPTSTAYSLFQFLDKTWKSYGCVKNNDIDNVTHCGIKYIQKRYGTPTGAKEHHLLKNWY